MRLASLVFFAIAVGITAAAAEERTVSLALEGEVAEIVVPDGFEVVSANGASMEIIQVGETFDTWTLIFSIAVLPHIDEPIAAFRETAKAEFLATCEKEGALSEDFPVTQENGFASAMWVEACDTAGDGPSDGKPETTVAKFIQGARHDLFVSIGMRHAATPAEIETWRAHIARTSLKPS